MTEVFPEPIRRLPQADIPLSGLTAYLLQGESQQVLFMEFDHDAEVPLHAHESQWSVVLKGRIDITRDGVTRTYGQGESIFVPRGVQHSARIHAGYADVTFFDEKSRYRAK
jgi:quercetin dioxygenase-like cupin family protein